MKFGKLLEEYEVPEWRGCYLPYSFLKKRLYEIADGRGDAAVRQLDEALLGGALAAGALDTAAAAAPGSGGGSGLLAARRPSFQALRALLPHPQSPGSISGPPPPSRSQSVGSPYLPPPSPASDPGGDAGGGGDGGRQSQACAAAWKWALEAEVSRISAFISRGFLGLQGKFDGIQKLDAEKGDGGKPAAEKGKAGYNLELRQLEVLGRLAEDVARLRGFSELNHVALFKILKKYDKVLHASDGLSVLYPRLIARSRLGEPSQFERLSSDIQAAFLQSKPCRGLNASLEVARIAAGLGMHSPGGLRRTGRSWTTSYGERLLFFFLGSCISLFVAIVILILLPCKSPKTFSTAYFMANFCAFRIVLSVALTFWGMGTVARVCDDNHINYAFLLGIDPRCRVGPNFLFVVAALMSALWIVFFGMYVIDYKWMFLPKWQTKSMFNKRASGLFIIYPLTLLMLVTLIVTWPSRVCRNRYKKAVLGCIGRTCLAPLYSVSFADNIVGDVLTSLAKPLQELPSSVCYITRHHPLHRDVVERFVVQGSTCHQWDQTVLSPVIAGAPFLFRLLQCARRFVDTRDTRHLWNLGKYSASLLVVVVSSLTTSTAVIVVVSALATAYAAIWDVCLDWGLGLQELALLARRLGAEASVSGAWVGALSLGVNGPSNASLDCLQPHGATDFEDHAACRGAPPAAEGAGSQRQHSGGPVRARESAACSAEGSNSSPSDRRAAEQRRFNPRFYWAAIAFDVAARSTWVLTLMPITLLSDNIVQRALLQTLMSSVEIARRSLWAILRIENEQVTNASGYRDFLWVPSKVNSEEDPAVHVQASRPAADTPVASQLAAPLLGAGATSCGSAAL